MATASHYEAHSADSYEQAYFYEAGSYQQYLVDLVKDRLQLQAGGGRHSILDVGGGTGNFAQALLKESSEETQITVVDPFLDPTTSLTAENGRLSFVKETAEVFLKPSTTANWRSNFSQVLLKEVAHHFADEDRVGIFRGMHQDLHPSPAGPSLLIITRPQTEIDYPLWDAARQVWKDNQPSVNDFCGELQEAGFSQIQHTLEAYPCRIALSRWQTMIKQRFWSTFSNFSDEQLEEACQGIARDYQDRVDKEGILHFEDRLVFITATKE